MKKAIVITTLLGLGFMLIAATLFITLPLDRNYGGTKLRWLHKTIHVL